MLLKIKSVLLVLCMFFSSAIYAANGINVIGFGTESLNLGGADVAVSRDTSALMTNPAGLSQLRGYAFDINASQVILDIEHRDQFGSDVNSAIKDTSAAGFGYAQRLKDQPMTVGIALYAQGGVGVDFPGMQTAFGTSDRLKSTTRIARVNAGFGYDVDNKLSVGFALSNVIADSNQEFFPETSFFSGDPSTSFLGSSVEGAEANATGYKVGMQYRQNDNLTWGVSYTSPVSLKFKNGQLVSNQSSLGLGKVTYRDLVLEGMDQPQEIAVGAAWQANKYWLFAFELNWIDWSKAIDETRLYASDPDNPFAPPNIESITDNNWRDQYVFSMGAEYQWKPHLILRAGYNYGRGPVPDNSLIPILAPITEHHILLGSAYKYDSEWSFDFVFEYDVPNSKNYTNDDLPFGADTYTRLGVIGLHFSAMRRW